MEIENAATRWLRSSTKNDITDINMQISAGSLTTVIGTVGAGKTTLLHMLLGELPCLDGTIKVNGTVSYASQEPWLFIGNDCIGYL